MPANYARFLTGRDRSIQANRQLGFALAFVAGAINAGGFLAVRQYTSHVTGMVSSLADNLALGEFALVVDAAVGVLAFLFGAMTCALLVNFVRADRDRIVVLAGLIAAFLAGAITGAFGFKLARYVSTVPLAIVLVLLAVVPVVDDLRRAARAHGG
ncbi:MAG: DUF1275 family protein [Burkholderiales bacterium]